MYFVDSSTGRTALHLAVANEKERAKVINKRLSVHQKSNVEESNEEGGESAAADATSATGTTTPPSSALSRLRVIKKLVRAHPRAISMRDTIRGYTPLAYACCARALDLVTLTEDAQIVEVLLDAAGSHVLTIPIPVSTSIRGGAAPSMSTTTQRDCSPLCLHILTVSFLASCTTLTSSTATHGPAITTAVLEALAAHATRAALEQALETLYVCNTHVILQMVADADARARRNKLRFGRQTSSTVDHDCWIWDWVLTLLRFIHKSNCHSHHVRRPFQALHVAAQVTDCPTPFVSLAMRAFPAQVRALDQATLQLPHHMVASWYINGSDGIGAGAGLDASSHGAVPIAPRSTCRQAMALSALTTEFLAALAMKNKSGQTPVELLKLSAAAVAAAAARDDATTSTIYATRASPIPPSPSRSSPRSLYYKIKSTPSPTVILSPSSSPFASPHSRSGRKSILRSSSGSAASITSSPGHSGVSRTLSGSSESRLPDADNPFYG